VTLQGDGGTVIHNLADGVAGGDAVNLNQLNTATNKWTIGNPSTYIAPVASGSNAFASGSGARATAANAVALGNSALASAANSVALGDSSVASRGAQASYSAAFMAEKQVSAGEVSVGSAGNTRQITHVAAGSAGTDAVNVDQLQAAVEDNAVYTTNLANGLSQEIADHRQESFAGAATAVAMANLPQAFIPGRSMVTAAVGSYRGQAALAIGLSRISDNGRRIFKLSGSVDSQRKGAFGVGAGFHW